MRNNIPIGVHVFEETRHSREYRKFRSLRKYVIFYFLAEFCDMPGAHEGLLGLRTIRLKRYSMLEPSQCIFY